MKAVTFYNPNCSILFASSTTIYKSDLEEVSIKDKELPLEDDYYSKNKLKSEKLIEKNIANYVIFRLPFVLTKPSNNLFSYNGVNSETIETITDLDAAYAFVKSLDILSKLNKKIVNLGGGSSCQINYKELINKVLLAYGVSFKYFSHLIFVSKNYHGHLYKDSDDLNKIIHFRNDSISSYLMRLGRQSKKRIVQRLIARLIVLVRNIKK